MDNMTLVQEFEILEDESPKIVYTELKFTEHSLTVDLCLCVREFIDNDILISGTPQFLRNLGVC